MFQNTIPEKMAVIVWVMFNDSSVGKYNAMDM
jgi:hypothetical protein